MKKIIILLALSLITFCGYSQLKLSELTSASSVGDADLFLITQGGSSKSLAYSLFKYNATTAAAQINDSLTNYLLSTQVRNEISDSLATLSFLTVSGNQYEIPFLNAAGSGLETSSNLSWNESLLFLTDGLNNINIGEGANSSNSTGISSVNLGYEAGKANKLGGDDTYNNVNIGFQAGWAAGESSDSSVNIGYRAGYLSTGNSGVKNIFIGFEAGYNETGSNKLYIENSNSATPLIYGDFENDTVRINGDLDVTGYVNPEKATHLFYYYGDSTISLSYTTSWQHLTNVYNEMWIYDENDGFTVSNDTITITYGGDYDFVAKNTCGNDANEVLSIRFYNITQARGIPVAGAVTGEGTNDFGSIPTEGYQDINAGDKIILQYKGDASGSVVFKNGIIKIYKIHE